MTQVREAGTNLIAQFTVPYQGTYSSVAANAISLDALYRSHNVFIREGKLRNRPGLTLLNDSVFDHPVIGGAMSVMPNGKKLLAFTMNELYTLTEMSTSWLLEDTQSFAGSNDAVIDIAFIETMSTYYALIANDSSTLKQYQSGIGVSVVSSAPSAKSVCVTARRVVCLVSPHTIQWSATLDHESWPALAIAKIAQTNDVGICVRSLSNLAFAVYKERSIYVARAQAGSDAAAFAFAEPLIVEGPAGIRSVVPISGTGQHMYMTTNGRVALFDGTRYPQWIADGLWLYLQSDIDPVYAYKICGVYDYRLHTVTFHYPRQGDEGQMYGVVIINLPLQGSGVQSYANFTGIMSKPVSHGFEMRFNGQIDRSVLFTSTTDDAQSFIFDEEAEDDDGTVYDCSIQTGLYPLPEMKHSQLSVEAFLERADGNGSLTISPVISDALENKTGTVVSNHSSIIDLNNNPVQEYTGFNTPCRFFGLQLDWSSTDNVRYAGMSLYGRILA